MAIQPPEIDAFPPAPQRGNKDTFADLFDAVITWFSISVSKVGQACLTAYQNAVAAALSASSAEAAAASAIFVAGATEWISGTSYVKSACVWSPITGATYRRRTTGAGSTDPSNDPANWSATVQAGFANMVVITTTQNWVVPAFVSRAKITVQGGGAGGIGGRLDVAANGPPGKSGGVATTVATGLTGKTLVCTVGSGGTGGPANYGGGSSGSGGVSSAAISGGSTLVSATGGTSTSNGTGSIGDLRLSGLAHLSLLNPYGAGGDGGPPNINGLNGIPGLIIIEF